MHASVSAQIVAAMDDEKEALAQYRRRLRDEPGAVPNLYFAYMLTLCAIEPASLTPGPPIAHAFCSVSHSSVSQSASSGLSTCVLR